MKLRLSASLLVLTLSAGGAAAQAPIPIYGPITISESGHYIVMKDLDDYFPGGAIQFPFGVSLDVDIDLNLHTVVGPIYVRGNFDTEACVKLTLRHGRVVGEIRAGWTATRYCYGSQVYLDHLTLDRSDVYAEDTVLKLTSSLVIDSELVSWHHNGVGVTPAVVIAGNQLFNSNISIRGTGPGQVVNNLIRDGSLYIGGTTNNSSAYRILVAGNTLSNGNIVGMRTGTTGGDEIRVVKNYVGGYIHFGNWSNSTIYQNKILGCGGRGSAVGVEFWSFYNQIDGNEFLGGCAHGIEFNEVTENNSYSGNIFRVPVPEPIIDDNLLFYGETSNSGFEPDVAPE